MVNFSIELDAGFESYFKKEIEKEVSLRLKSSINNITEAIEIAIQSLVKLRLNEAPEVDSLASGELRHQFGLVDGASRISNIIDMWAESVEVREIMIIQEHYPCQRLNLPQKMEPL